MPDEPEYSIGELAEIAGVTTRTIRYYTAEGLLPQPQARGRYARYGDAHLTRLRQIAELKARYLPLHAIRARLATGEAPPTPQPEGPAAASPLSLGPRRLAERPQPYGGGPLLAAGPLDGEGQPLQLGRYEFFPDTPEPPLEAGLGGRPAPAERWQRITIAPGVELHVREPIGSARRERLAALIAAARDQLAAEEEGA